MAQYPLFYFKSIQTNVSDLLMSDDELKEGVNVNLSEIGIVQKRPGYVQAGDTIQSNKSVLGLSPYYNSDGTAQLVVAINNSSDDSLVLKCRTTQNYSVTLATIASYQDAKVEFCNFMDYLWGVGYQSSGGTFLPPFNWTGSAYSTSTYLTNRPVGKFIDVCNGYLAIANGKDESNNRATSRVWWATPPTTLPPSISWDNVNNYWDFQPHDGEEITGFKANFNRFLVFKNTSFHLFDPVGQTSNVVSNSIGCDSHRTIQNIDKYTIFFNRKGVYATSGGEPQIISNSVDKFIKAIDQDDLEDVCAGVRDNRYYHIFIGTVTVGDTTYTNCELVYDVFSNSWTTNELQNIIKVYCNYVQPIATTSTSTSSSSSSSTSSSRSSSSSSSSQSTTP